MQTGPLMQTAVLLSGGLDSAVLLAEEAARGDVQPIYVSVGLAWERAETTTLGRLLGAAPLHGRVRPLVSLTVDMSDVYAATHWAVRGQPPEYHTADEDVYLPGRNVVLLGKAGVYCAAARIDRLVLGTLAHNPFPDATPEFRSAMARALSLGLAHPFTIEAPYAAVGKAEVVRRGQALGVPFDLTLSCMGPIQNRDVHNVHDVHGVHRVPGVHGDIESGELGEPREPREPGEPWFVHCGVCSKCRERHDAFLEAGAEDTTDYANREFMTA
jgi:7-cyano-7-deazaguanine synthase